MLRSWPFALKLVAAFLVVATFFAMQNALVHVSRGAPIDWQWDVMHEYLYWLVWAACTPLVLRAARRWPPSRDRGWTALLPHLGVAALIAPSQISATYLTHFTVLRLTGWLPPSLAARWLISRGPGVVWGTFAGFLYYWVIAAVWWVVEFQRLYRAQRLEAARLEASFSAARLDALRSQLQPHFLFNTLNAIAVLTADAPADAKQMVLRLSELLRRSIGAGDRHEVPLAEELELLDAYLGIQRARFRDRLRVQLDIAPDVGTALAPTLILQPLVENAIRHGLEDVETGGQVAIAARRDGDDLVLTVRDDGRGLADDAPESEGIGLANTRERLLRLYGARHRFELRSTPGAGVTIEVSIPFRPTP